MVEAYYLAFSGGLNAILKAIGLPPKDDRGGRLINLFSSPAPKNHKAKWYDWGNRPAEWEEFCQYCIQDVAVERQLWHWMRKYPYMPAWDLQQWILDQSINDRGVGMDVNMARHAIDLWESERQRLENSLQHLTRLPKVTRAPFIRWVKDHTGIALANTRRAYLTSLLDKGRLPESARDPIQWWEQKEAKAASKYQAVIQATGPDGRARGMFQYKGASRTDRVGGRLIQLQNLKRPFAETPEEIRALVAAICTGDPQILKIQYPGKPVSNVLGCAVRHAITASPGYVFAVADLSSIESVVLGWLTECAPIDQTFRAGRDSYKVFAAEYFGIPYEQVTKAQRGFSKPPVLGCGYRLGWKGLIAYAEGYGVDMQEEQAQRAVDTFRTMYPEIPTFWAWIDNAVRAVTASNVTVTGYRLTIERDADFLRVWLPSGRALSYYKPEIIKNEAPWSTPERPATVLNFSYMGTDLKNQWTRIHAHSGGLTENLVQSIAGDILWHGITQANAAGLPVVLHVHDEIAVEVPTWQARESLSTLIKCMATPPAWCKDMWLGANGFLSDRYTKD
jgi:DNA polymerase